MKDFNKVDPEIQKAFDAWDSHRMACQKASDKDKLRKRCSYDTGRCQRGEGLHAAWLRLVGKAPAPLTISKRFVDEKEGRVSGV